MRKYDVTTILYQYVIHERNWTGQDEENECGSNIALYPSEFKKQISLTTRERLRLGLSMPIRSISKSVHSSIIANASIPLKIIPKEIIFQQFNAGMRYNTTITISNTAKISHFVKLICKANEIFHVDFKESGPIIRLAPGMSHVYNIQFNPLENRDYENQIDLVGDFKTLNIPLIALGPRPILDIPDRIILPDTPVNITISKTIYVRNVGNAVAIYSISSLSAHFSVKPSCGVIKEKESSQFIIYFVANTVGTFTGIICLRYETGELLRIDISGVTFNCDVRLDREILLLDDTFVGLSTSKSLKIFNNSDYIVKFQWMKYKNIQVDNEEKKRLTMIYDAIEDHSFIPADIDYTNIYDSQTYEAICRRVHEDEITLLTAEKFSYCSSTFTLTPMTGEIGPRSLIEISVNFRPITIGKESSNAYLEITGCVARLPICFSGLGKGPILKLNATTMDIGNIYLGSIHNCEIVCFNESLIPGILIAKEKSSDFGGDIVISPQTLNIQPGEYSSFTLSFSSTRNGEFVETVEFFNEENSETLFVYIKGHVICPILYFDQTQLDLGVVALGFTSKHEVTIRNVSSVPVTFSISIPDDGNEAAISYETFVNTTNFSIPIIFPKNPQEFSITPNNITLAAHSSYLIKINFTPNIAQTRKTCLKIIIHGSDTIPIILPILFISKVASCTILTSGLHIRFAFINFPYTAMFTIKNTSDVEGFFYCVRDSALIDSPTLHSISRNHWHLKPGQSRAASITIITRTIGPQTIKINMRTLGKNDLDNFTVTFNGHGPVISVVPKHLNFEHAQLLHEQSMPLELINDSPIPAHFKIHVAKMKSPWSIPIDSGAINPLKSIKLIVKLYLRDIGKQTDKILITVTNSTTISVTLSAYGSGSCIRIQPNIFPDFQIGHLLSYQNNFVPMNLINEGNRWQKIILSNTTAKRNARSVPQIPNMTIFKIDPHVIDLPPRSTTKTKWLIYSDKCEKVTEQWWIYAAIQGHAKRELIGMSNLSTTFIEPAVKFNKTELNFYINFESDNDKSIDKKIRDEIEMINLTEITLQIHVSIQYPFEIIIDNDQQVNHTNISISSNSASYIKICFSPNIKDSHCYSENFVEYLKFKYDEHPNIDEIKCKGAVNYPNINLVPQELKFDVPLNESMTQTLSLNNPGPIPAIYQFSWVQESINVQYIHKIESSISSQKHAETLELKNDDNNKERDTESLKTAICSSFPKETINQLFEISPLNGVLIPFSSSQITINFCAREFISLSARLLCQVAHGSSEYIKVTARADTIKYSLEKTEINFGHQTLFAMCHNTIHLSNICKIQFSYNVDTPLENKLNSKGILSIKPIKASVKPGKISQVQLNYQSIVPGYFEEIFNFTIGNLMPNKITVKGWAILPQVYLPLPPRNFITNNTPIEYEYNAIRFLDIDEKFSTDEVHTSSINTNIHDFQRLKNYGWEIVSRDDDTIPEIMDIEMIIEKHLAVQHINENMALITTYISSNDSMPIPLLFSPTYELDLGYVIIERHTNYSVAIINYSSCKISVRMRKNEKENYLTKYGLTVKFRDRINLMPKEFSILDIDIYPLRKNIFAYNKLMKRQIYIEVINGCTIPIKITANITSPRLIVNTNSLDFGDVMTGNCRLMNLSLYNNGFINCNWKIEFVHSEKKAQTYFHLDNYEGHLTPDELKIISIYFKPQKSSYIETKLTIIVHDGLEPLKVILFGRGIEKKLKIDETSIEFLPVIPCSMAVTHEFSIKNIVNLPIEFYWHHLDDLIAQEDRVIRILLHYYRVEEILLPFVDVGPTIPKELYDFYISLIDDMIKNTNISNEYLRDTKLNEQISQLADDSISDRNSKLVISTSEVFSYKAVENSMLLTSKNSEQVEELLHLYIDKLHENPDLFKLKVDPLKELFDDRNKQNDCTNTENNVLKKKVGIIFHGAPFTQYQETACRVANSLNLSLINLDSAIIEIIALGDSSNSIQLRNLIDHKYEELLQIAMKLTNNFHNNIPLNSRVTKVMNSIEIENDDFERFKKNINFNLPQPDDPIIYFKNIPDRNEMNLMKPLCHYEYKIEGICHLQKIIKISGTMTSMMTDEDKSFRKGPNKSSNRKRKINKDKTFLNVDLNILKEIFWEIFNNDKYKRGFVLQTLNNNFIKNDVVTLASIQQAIGNIKFMAFITFHNSLEVYKQKYTEKLDEILLKQQEKLSMRLEAIDEMSSSDFESLPDDEKLLFFRMTLRPRINEAQQRRMKFKMKLESGNVDSNIEVNKENGESKEKSKRRENVNIKDKKKEKFESETLHKINEKFINYKINLASIESLIKDHFYIWHVRFDDPWDAKTYESIINQLMKNQEIKANLVDNVIAKPVFKSQLYSIVSKRSQRHNNMLQTKWPFKLVEISFTSKSNEDSSNISILKESIEVIPSPRVILEPKQQRIFKIIFEPTHAGTFVNKFELSIVGANNKNYEINVIGKADFPHIQMDPTIIFNNVKYVKHDDESNIPTFYINKNTFDFGSLLTFNNIDDYVKVQRNISQFKFFNSSLVNVDIEFSLANNNWAMFSVAPRSISIKPNEFGSIHVTAVAKIIGINTDRLLLMIKDNPRVEEIILECYGCKLDVELNIKNLSFNRVLLSRKIYKSVILKNKSPLPIFWKILEDHNDPQIVFSMLSNRVQPSSDSNIEVCYHGQKIGPTKKHINIGIFSNELNEKPLLLENITITGETYEILVDVNPINLHNGKINQMLESSFTITNRGQYDINYIIELENVEKILQIHRDLLKNLKENLRINPSSGLLFPHKTASIKVTFVPKFELHLKAASLLKCNLLDTNAEPSAVAELPLTVTMRAEYSKFEIEPYPKLIFGPVNICSRKQKLFCLRNIGIFPIQYRISSKHNNDYQALSIQSRKLVDSKYHKLKKTSKKEKSKMKNNQVSLRLGPFTFKQNYQGLLNINQVKEIIVDCYSDTEGHFENEILIFVDNCSIKDQNGRILKISTDFHIPTINFTELDFIFQESHIVKNIEDFICPSVIKPFTIFVKEQMCLHFKRVLISTTHSLKLKLYNMSLVPADVSICLQSNAMFPKNSPPHTFTLDQTKLYILPLSSHSVTVSFTPTLMETFIGLLEISVDLPSHIEGQKLSIKLLGEGLVAEIALIKPEIFCKRGHAILEYGKCLVGETHIEDICFKNIGNICANITVEVIEDIESHYELKIAQSTNDKMILNEIIKKHCIEVNLKPGELRELLVLFIPKNEGKCEAHVRLLIAENPYENLMINLNGEGFTESIILMGLPLNNDSNSLNSSVSLIYILEFGCCFLNEEKKMSFKIVNKSTDKFFKFEWDCHENFTIKPSIGHLYCLSDKDITVTFISNQPVSYSKVRLNCTICQVKILENYPGVAWDDQHLKVDWIVSSLAIEEKNIEDSVDTFMEKVISLIDEPAHEIINSISPIQLMVSATTSHAVYFCSIDEINFEDTFMFKTRERKFEVTNIGEVNLIYTWKIKEMNCHSVSSENNFLQTPIESLLYDEDESDSKIHNWNSSIDLTNESVVSMNVESYKNSFEIEPDYGTIISGQSKEFIIRFRPRDAVHYRSKLSCKIENLNPDIPPLQMFINGTSLLPYYHFYIRKSNYLLNKGLTSPPDMEIVEFNVIGVKRNYIKHFTFINPTVEVYHYFWTDQTPQSTNNIPYFHCKVQNGIAIPGTKIKITFTFLAREIGEFEALWSFSIHEYKLQVPFLLVGIVREPRVTCCTPKLTLGPTICGVMIQSTIIIHNNEKIPLSYKIIKDSVYSEGGLQCSRVEPMSGILSPHNNQELIMYYKPSCIGEIVFLLLWDIEKMKEPLKCSVTVDVYKIKSCVFFSYSAHEKIKLKTTKINIIELGKLMYKKKIIYTFEMINDGDVAYEYTWNLNTNSSKICNANLCNYKIEMNEMMGRVEQKSKTISTLEIIAMRRVILKNYPITLKIINGPSYDLRINATAKCGSIEFSFTQHDFGACYINKCMENSSYSVELQITNNEHTFVIVKCEKIPQNFIANLEKLTQAIPEHTTISLPITFQPREMKKYYETLSFTINSDIEQNIELKGEGIGYKVSLVKARDKIIELGNVLIGKIIKRRFSIINLAKASVKLKVDFLNKTNTTSDSSNIFVTVMDSINFEPSEFLTLRPNKPHEISMKFSPITRMSLFEEKIGGICADSTIIPLAFIRGRCIGAEFNLNPTHLQFDTIVKGLSLDNKLVLHNSGDIGARFKWNIKKLGRDFTIKPLTGYASAGKKITFNVCFHPIEPSYNIKSEAFIEIENYQSIPILLSGICSNLPDPINTIIFSIPVREKMVKNIDINNDLHISERIEITLTGRYFQSESIIFIDAKSSAQCAITYAPLLMNTEKNPHEGTLVINFSRQKAIKIYVLRGISLPPTPLDTISREIPTKTEHYEMLRVHNWHNKPQYFNCHVELIGNYKEPPIYTFNGNDKIEILSNNTRNYQMIFCCYKGSLLNFNVSFTNSEGEYQFYKIQYNITKPETIDTIELKATIHKSCTYLLEICNPLENESITYTGNCQHSDIKLEELPKTVAPKLKELIKIHYFPTIASESETILHLTSTKLGLFSYKLKLIAISGEKVQHTLSQITTSLGSSQLFNIAIINNSKQIDEFEITIDDPSFICQINRIAIPPGDENTIDIIYEPCNIETIQAQLSISSTLNPKIIYNLSGNGIIPTPKGPFTLTPKQPLTIPFKNVFLEAKTFKCIVDPTVSFAMSFPSNVINSKQTANIMVSFLDMNTCDERLGTEISTAVTGKLIIYCTDDELSSINWIYYLKGICQ